jgi:O-antigen/teichoic acid export membrane protein
VRNYFNLSKSQIIRHTGYLFWTIMAQALDLGLTRVVLFPLVIYIAGKEEFGVFAIALSVVMIVGIQPATGLITGLLRHMAEYSEEKRAQFYQTAMRLNHIAMTVVIALGLLIIAILWQTSLVPPKLLKCILPLAISLYTENQFALALTELRYIMAWLEIGVCPLRGSPRSNYKWSNWSSLGILSGSYFIVCYTLLTSWSLDAVFIQYRYGRSSQKSLVSCDNGRNNSFVRAVS